MKQDEFIGLEDQFGAHNYKPLDVVLARGKGVWVWDVDGNKYMDLLSYETIALTSSSLCSNICYHRDEQNC